jgi:hypothetical protein
MSAGALQSAWIKICLLSDPDPWSSPRRAVRQVQRAWLLRNTPLSDPHLAPGVAPVEELARQAALSGYNSDALIEVCAAALRGSKAERRNKDDDTGCDQHEAQDHFADN